MWITRISHPRSKRCCRKIALAALAAMLAANPGLAYRPFDGTDAAVADEGEIEVELQPAGTLREGSDKTLIGPAAVINYGFAKNWEAVVKGQIQTPLSLPDSVTLAATVAFLKHVIREGSLQDKTGPGQLKWRCLIETDQRPSVKCLTFQQIFFYTPILIARRSRSC